jgi:hypothetical protein
VAWVRTESRRLRIVAVHAISSDRERFPGPVSLPSLHYIIEILREAREKTAAQNDRNSERINKSKDKHADPLALNQHFAREYIE